MSGRKLFNFGATVLAFRSTRTLRVLQQTDVQRYCKERTWMEDMTIGTNCWQGRVTCSCTPACIWQKVACLS